VRTTISFALLLVIIGSAGISSGENASNKYKTNALSNAATRSDHIRYINIPPDVDRRDVVSPDADLKLRLHDFAKTQISNDSMSLDKDHQEDLVIIFVDGAGVPILPNVEEAARKSNGPMPADGPSPMDCPTSELTFTFNSPTYPWSSADQAVLTNMLSDFYQAAKVVCGNPLFNNSVNLRKDPTISFAGLYYPSLNEMVVKNTNSPDVVCHEMIHAFRDDLIMGLPTFEEGMTWACEVEVLNRLPAYITWDSFHSYPYDVYYESFNQRVVGGKNGNIFLGWNALLRYQLAGYAWAKCFLENEDFFRRFNCELFRRTLLDATTPYVETNLFSIANDVQQVAEGDAFPIWYQKQCVLNTSPQTGYFLFQRVNQFTIDFVYRDAFGNESLQPNASIEWSVLDFEGRLLDSGYGMTDANGFPLFTYPYAMNTNSYAGRIQLFARAASTNGTIANASFRPMGPYGVDYRGIFGVVVSSDSGTVQITPLDEPASAVTLNVENGAFSAPTLSTNRGRFLAEFRTQSGVRYQRQFNKDRSDYYLELNPLLLISSGLTTSNQDVMTVKGEFGRNYGIESSTNLSNWQPVASETDQAGKLQILLTNTSSPAKRFYRAATLASSPAVFIPATSGAITAPFFATNGYISQTNETTVTTGGRAAFNFAVSTAGNYVIQTKVNAPDGGANSFFVNINAEPQNPNMIWDVPTTVGFEKRTVSWRGNGITNSEFVPKVFALTTNQQQLIIRGREADVQLQSITIVPWP